MIGSHIDTVPNGGRFDGLAGTISALEVIRTIKENNIDIKSPVELVIFSEEERSNFGSTTLGSKIMTGKITKEDLKNIYNDKEQSAYDVMKNFNLDVESIGENILSENEVKAMIEIHIEQGSVLEKADKSVGVVTDIAGMNTYEVSLTGQSNHAGTTPMDDRQDPLIGASEVVLSMEEFTRTKANDTTVATVGRLVCSPSGSNVINQNVTFNVDIRDVDPNGVEATSQHLKEIVAEVSKKVGLEYDLELVGHSEPAALSDSVIDTLEDIVQDRGIDYIKTHSGAVHDAMMLVDKTEVGMIFVPSKDGISHSPDEYTLYEDLEAGANLMLGAVVELANA
jgi:hydantoinase/carbamoylase family amidase